MQLPEKKQTSLVVKLTLLHCFVCVCCSCPSYAAVRVQIKIWMAPKSLTRYGGPSARIKGALHQLWEVEKVWQCTCGLACAFTDGYCIHSSDRGVSLASIQTGWGIWTTRRLSRYIYRLGPVVGPIRYTKHLRMKMSLWPQIPSMNLFCLEKRSEYTGNLSG